MAIFETGFVNDGYMLKVVQASLPKSRAGPRGRKAASPETDCRIQTFRPRYTAVLTMGTPQKGSQLRKSYTI